MNFIHIFLVSKNIEYQYFIINKQNNFELNFTSFNEEQFLFYFAKGREDVFKNCLFIFTEMNYGYLVNKFAELGISLSGGSATKRHFISNMQQRLSSYLNLIFNNSLACPLYFNKFNLLSKEEYSSKFNHKLSNEDKLKLSQFSTNEIIEFFTHKAKISNFYIKNNEYAD